MTDRRTDEQTDGQTDGQTENTICRAAWSQLKIQQWAFADISTWLEFMEKYNGVTFFRHPRQILSNEINLISDASKLGFGAAFGSHWIQERWP